MTTNTNRTLLFEGYRPRVAATAGEDRAAAVAGNGSARVASSAPKRLPKTDSAVKPPVPSK